MDVLQQIISVFVVLGLLAAALVFTKRASLANFTMPRRNGAARRMTVIETLRLTTQNSIHLVQIDDRTVVVGVSPSGLQVLSGGERQ